VHCLYWQGQILPALLVEAGGKAKKAKQRRSHNSRKRDKLAMLIALCSDSGGHD